MSARKPAYAGLRRWYPNPLTGGHVGLYDGIESGDDTGGGRWQTICEDHGHICSHDTFEIARLSGPHPADFCEHCMALERGEVCTVDVDDSRRYGIEPRTPVVA